MENAPAFTWSCQLASLPLPTKAPTQSLIGGPLGRLCEEIAHAVFAESACLQLAFDDKAFACFLVFSLLVMSE